MKLSMHAMLKKGGITRSVHCRNKQKQSTLLCHLRCATSSYILLSFLTAHPFTAITATIHAINSPTSPIVTV